MKSARAVLSTLLLATLACCIGGPAFAQTSVLQNGSFESNFTSWTATGDQVIATSDPLHPASAGTRVVVFNPGTTVATAVLSQTFPTTAGQRYGLAFDVGRVGGVIDGRLRVTVAGASVLLNQILEFTGIGASPFYIPQNMTFVANSASTTLTFADLSISPLLVDSFLDNVRVVAQNAQLPLITSQPVRTAVAAGQNATFAVTASGTGLSYQWQFNGTNIAGATGPSVTVNATTVAAAGNYSVVVTNATGSVSSSAATLLVLPADILLNGSFEFASAAWTINDITRVYSTLNPAYQYSDGVQLMHFNYGQRPAGGTLSQTFATQAGVEYLLSFDPGAFSLLNQNEARAQIRVQGASTLLLQNISVFAPGNGTTFVPQLFSFVADGTSATLTFTDTSPTTLNVDLVIDNVKVVRADALPAITAHPQNATVPVGGDATFAVTATGPGPLFYQWRFNGSPIAGADESTHIITGAQPANAGSYDVVVSNANGQTISNAATLAVIASGGLTNGSFELGITGWTATGSAPVVDADAIYVATDGTRAVAFNAGTGASGGTVAQSFATAVGQGYVLAFDVGAVSFVNTNVQQLEVTVQGSGTLLTQVISVAAPGNGTQYVPQSFAFVANSAATTLTFRDLSASTINVDLMLDNVRVTLQNAPTITAQPQSLTVSPGAPATFSVTAAGQGPLTYQWRFNQANISGATASSYTIASAQASHAGTYDVVVSNSFGSVTSATVTLTVQSGGGGPFTNGSFELGITGWTATGSAPVVDADAIYVATDGTRAVAFNAGQAAPGGTVSQTFATAAGQGYVLAFDAGAVSFVNTNVQQLEVTVQGSGTLLTQVISVAAPGNGTQYVPQSFAFVANSAATTLTFRDLSASTINVDLMLDNVRVTLQNAPTITAQPQSLTVSPGAPATFSVTAAGQGPLTYQWRFNQANISGATASSYSIASAQASHAGTYDVVVSNSFGSVTSATVTLTVQSGGGGPFTNGSFELGITGWTATGSAPVVDADAIYVATDGTRAVAFNAGQAAPGGTVSQTFATAAGQGYVLAFDAGAVSFVNTNVQQLEVTVQGSGTLLTQVISVAAPGNGTQYVPQSFAFVANSAATTLTFRDLSASTINVDLMLDNVRVTLQNAPTITAQPQSLTVSPGAPATFSVTAAGQGPLTYQWRFNQANISGATASSYSIASAQASHAGTYDVVVSNSFGSVTSATVTLTVQSGGGGPFTNGSFESGITGWTATGSAPVVTADAIYVASDGTRVVAFNAGQAAPSGVVSQSFATAVGQGYVLAFDVGAVSFLNTNVQRLEVTVQGNGTLLTQVVSVAAPGNGTQYVPQSFAFVANSATTTLRFRDVSTSTVNVDLMLDNVRVTPGSLPQELTNGSFENGFTAWTASGHQNIATSNPARPASQGSSAVVLNPSDQVPDAMLSQTFGTTAGQRYELAFDLGTVARIADQRIRVRVVGSATLLDQVLVVAGPHANPFYVPHALTFVADGSSATLTFVDESFTYVAIDGLLDNVRVTPQSAQLPLITSPPGQTAAAQGGNATFSVAVSGTGPFTYQWQFGSSNISGATGSSHTVVGAAPGNAGNYRVVVTNAAGSVTSSAATLTVLPPAILLNGSFEFGSAAWTFNNTSVATSTNPAHGVTDGVQLAHFNWGQQPADGVLSQSFATTPGQQYVLAFDVGAESLVNQAEQRVEVTLQGNAMLRSELVSVFAPGNGTLYVPKSYAFTADSATTTLTFEDASLTTLNVDLVLDNVRITPQGAPVITAQPQSATVAIGAQASFSVTATGGSLSYQWRFNGVAIAGATASTYTIASAQSSHAGNYDVVVSNAAGNTTSSTATLTVLTAGGFTNGSFEAGFNGWTRSGNAAVVTAGGIYVATNGSRLVAFNGGQSAPNAVLSQSFATTPGQAYTLRFDVGAMSFVNSNQQRMQVTVQGSGTLVSQLVTVSAPGNGTRYVARSFVFTASSTTTTVTFQDVSTTTRNIDLVLDNVRVTQQP